MEKIVLHIYIPNLQEWVEAAVPSLLTVGEVTALLGSLLEEVTENRYLSSGKEFLCTFQPERVLKREKTLREYGLLNGDRVLFM